MASDKPRILHSSKDMMFSLIPLVIMCVIIAAIASQCAFRPGGPKEGPIPNFDVDASLKYDASELAFPIRNPHVPDGWKPNSGSRTKVNGPGGGDVSTVGYITDAGAFMQLSQSNATEDALVPALFGDRSATGSNELDGHTWVIYAEKGSEPLWVADFTQVRVLLKGAGTTDEFTALAHAVDAATPLKSRTP
ncbi:DUF4245 domain-containing protein [Antrihabitans cavernicola]|uniref:DUF4245 domain-containing protein n=1 Tax=Antrihabitans cavernicola TaxID=2495913 RepID=A0A5A7SHF4_9NOCA|nr:DUF4245 domain-containing protein [Spelaeibacter cavernicola]KAA0023925.1 DUF4245 domain-containing protein [Spelaeibacter cavernicola]